MPDRIAYGGETDESLPNGDPLYIAREAEACHDCGVGQGELHTPGCDVEQCPVGQSQLIGCDHAGKILAEEAGDAA